MENYDVGQSFENVLDSVINWIPNILVFLVVVLVGYFVALALAWAVKKALHYARLDDYLERGPIGGWLTNAVYSPSRFINRVVFWVVWFGFFGVAATLANLPLIGNLVAAIYDYLPNVLSALFIFVLAVGVSAAVINIVKRTMGDTPTGKIVASAVPVLVMSIAAFAILNALRISPEIVQITYAAIMGSLALGLALAFGLGGRDVAARMLEDAYKSGQRQAKQARKDFQTGTKRGQQELKKIKDEAEKKRQRNR